MAIVGLIFVYQSLGETKRAGDEAKRAADIANQSLIAANRAWLAPRVMAVDGDIKGKDDIPFRLFFENIGKSLAINVRQGARIDAVPDLNKSGGLYTGDYNACDRVVFDKQAIVIYPDSRDHWQNGIIHRQSIPASAISDFDALVPPRLLFV